MLLNIYLGTTAISWIITIIYTSACEKKIKREGYKIKKEKKSLPEKVIDIMSIIFKGSIPVYNIFNAICLLCLSDKVYEQTKANLIKQGKIYKINDLFATEKETTSTTRSYSQDAYIKSIQETMDEVIDLKYPGYEKDLKALYKQAEDYLNAKKQKATTSPSEVLSTQWFDPLVEIESKLPKASKLKKDQTDIIEALKQMKELLEKEGVTTQKQEETSGYTPTLRL